MVEIVAVEVPHSGVLWRVTYSNLSYSLLTFYRLYKVPLNVPLGPQGDLAMCFS